MKKMILVMMIGAMLLSGCDNKQPASSPAPKGDSGVMATLPENSPPANLPEQTADATQGQHDAPISVPAGDMVVIKEKMFIAQTNDIYFNAEDYLGKTINYEGIFSVYEVPDSDDKFYSVIRYGPGCCGVDANAGFEVVWDKDYPTNNDWVEAVGVLEEYEYDGMKYLWIQLSSLTVLPTRGEEYVAQ